MSQPRRPQILMVDDESDSQDLVRRWIEPAYEHLPLSDGDGLKGKLASLRPDAVILDIHIPGTDGFKLCKLIRAQAGYEEVPWECSARSFPSRRSTSRPGAATSPYS